MRRSRASLLTLSLLGALLVPTTAAPAAAQPADGTTFISEFHYDNDGTDEGEFVEVTAPAGTDLTGFSLVLYNGNGDAAYDTSSLSGTVTDQGDGYGTVVITYPSNGIQNGDPDGIALVDDAGELVEFLSYGGTFTADGGPADGVESTDVGVTQTADTPVGSSIERTGEVPDEYEWVATDTNSEGAVNDGLVIDDDAVGGGDDGDDPGDDPEPADGPIFISEFHYDNAGADEGEFVEVTAPAGTDLTGWEIQPYNGNGGGPYGATALSGTVADEAEGYGAVALDVVGLQNGSPDGIALIDDTGELVEFISYEGTFTAVGGPADSETSTDVGVAEEGDASASSSIERVGDIPDEFVWEVDDTNSEGVPNPGSTIDGTTIPDGGDEGDDDGPPPSPMCGDDFTPTYDIQGDGAASPLDGDEVAVEGVVVADLLGEDEFGTFYLQDPDGDGDDATSDGLAVFAPDAEVEVGDAVRVTGTVDEFFGLTQVDEVSSITECDEGTTIEPTVLPLPLDDEAREHYEGMLVTVDQQLSVTDAFNLHVFGEVLLSSGDPLQSPTNVFDPDSEAAEELAEENDERALLLDDRLDIQLNRDPFPLPEYLGEDGTLRRGSTLEDLTGVLSFGFDEYRIQPTEDVEFDFAERPESPDDVGGDVTVGSFNVLNYFTTIDEQDAEYGDARGADSPDEFERQEDKIVAGILGLGADVVGIQEIEDEMASGAETPPVEVLVDALNDEADEGTWAAVGLPEDYESNNPIRNAILYRADRVEPVGGSVSDDDEVWNQDRPPIAQTFEADGEVFTVISNHFKSKGGDCSDDVLEGCFNDRRVNMSEALLDFIDELQESSGDDDVLAVGDFNSYLEEDPIDVLEDGGLVNLAEEYGDEENPYSFVFFGAEGLLDYIFVTPELADRVTGSDVWHINADEPRGVDYNNEELLPDDFFHTPNQPGLYEDGPYRSSDHDPLIAGFDAVDDEDDGEDEQPASDQPESKDDCKDGGWQEFEDPSYRNQGRCVASVASDGKSGGNGPGRGNGRGGGGGPPR